MGISSVALTGVLRTHSLGTLRMQCYLAIRCMKWRAGIIVITWTAAVLISAKLLMKRERETMMTIMMLIVMVTVMMVIVMTEFVIVEIIAMMMVVMMMVVMLSAFSKMQTSPSPISFFFLIRPLQPLPK